jgi:hypothetical protein
MVQQTFVMVQNSCPEFVSVGSSDRDPKTVGRRQRRKRYKTAPCPGRNTRGNGVPRRGAWQGACLCLPSCLARNAEPEGESPRGAAPGRMGRGARGARDATRRVAGRRRRCRGHAGLCVRVCAEQLRLALWGLPRLASPAGRSAAAASNAAHGTARTQVANSQKFSTW